MNSRTMIFTIALACFAPLDPAAARWAWEASAVDERQLLDQHSETLVSAHEGYKRLAMGDAPRPFDTGQLTSAVVALNNLLQNSVKVGNEEHYAALVTRVREQLDDRVDRTEYEIGRLLSSGGGEDRARLRRLIEHDYFALPRLLRVASLSRYEALESKIRSQLGI